MNQGLLPNLEGNKMTSARVVAVLGSLCLGLAGCASIPDKSELQRVDKAEIESQFVGNTLTQRTDYGRWAEYNAPGSNGYVKASGTWGGAIARSSYQVSDDGEICSTYAGPHDWSTPEHRYCSVVYKDAEGNYYMEATVDTYKPEDVGKIRSVELKPGDAYGLSTTELSTVE